MYRLPAASTATPWGPFNCALAAGPPSPEYPVDPFPATVPMMAPLAETLRTRLLPKSAMYTLPEESTATPMGRFSCALAAAPPSPP